MIRKVEEKTAVELFKRIYRDSAKRTLLIDDGSTSGWEETDTFPKIGACELLIDDIQAPINLTSFLSMVRDYYLKKPDETFFFMQEEEVTGSECVEIVCDLSSLEEIVRLANNTRGLNAVLCDASFAWALKFHHEGFGYFSGEEDICNLLRNSELAGHVLAPIWL
jgi:hypothetical protein